MATCPACKQETPSLFFCHACDAFLANPRAGKRAGVARRLAALFLDGVAFWVVFFVILILAGAVGAGLTGGSRSANDAAAGVWGTTFTLLFAIVGYVIFLLWFLGQGKTPGKWLVGIRAVNKTDGGIPGLGRMLVRETFGKFCSGIFFGLGYFWAIWDPGGQGWHDKIAGTLVVHGGSPVSASPRPLSSVASPARGISSQSSGPRPFSSDTAVTHAAAPSVAPVSAPSGTYCDSCGAAREPGAAFCSECGGRF